MNYSKYILSFYLLFLVILATTFAVRAIVSAFCCFWLPISRNHCYFNKILKLLSSFVYVFDRVCR